MSIWTNKRFALMASLMAAALAACSDDPEPSIDTPADPAPPEMVSFSVTITNLTNAQPLSPIALIAHTDGYTIFTIGSPASAGLEVLAEEGDNADLLAEAEGNANVISTISGDAPIGPGNSETFTVEVPATDLANLMISISTMLVNTNDAITGAQQVPLSFLSVDESMILVTNAYDAGTEANTETAASIPGPAANGEGFNATRDDRLDAVTAHKGVVTTDDGLTTSALTGQHRFDNPVSLIRIVRSN